MSVTIRAATAADRDAVYDVCLRTADAGANASERYRDPELPGHIWAGPYLERPGAHAFVAEEHGRVLGYVLGALDSRSVEADLERAWWPPLRDRYPLDTPATSRAERVALLLIHHAPRAPEDVVADFPSHLHIDLLPDGQGRGLGRRLIEHLVAALRADGSPGVHLGVDARNTRAIGFYRAVGFTELHADPRHHVFGMRLG